MVLFAGKCQHGLVGPTCIECYRLALADAQVDGAELAALRDKLLLQIEGMKKKCQPGPCRHCNCYKDIDYDFPGCTWCEILKENVETAKDLQESNRLNEELQKKLTEIVGVMQGSMVDKEAFETVYRIAKGCIERPNGEKS